MTASVLDAGGLDTNRAGGLADTQRTAFAGIERVFTRELRGVAVVLAAIGLLVAFGASGTVPALTRLLVAGAFLAAAAGAGWFSLVGRPGLERDLREGRVVRVEGAIGRDRVQGQGGQATDHYLTIEGKRYRCSREAYDAAAEPGIVRLYVLPHSHRVVNFERLPDRPIPEQMLTSAGATTVAMDAIRETLLHPGGGRTEALATAVAFEHAMVGRPEGETGGAGPLPGATSPGAGDWHAATAAAAEAAPPVAAAADALPATAAASPASAPLAAAIVGRWRDPMADVTFSADGSVSARLAMGMALAGRWSVGSDGRLHLAGMGEDMATDARIAGDTLTLELGSMPMALRRVGA